MASPRSKALHAVSGLRQFLTTSGATDPVWHKLDPPSNRPKYQPLTTNKSTDTCIVGAGIAGLSLALELVRRGRDVVVLEAREVISGESGRTSGHLSNALDDTYPAIKAKHGQFGAKAAAESHSWAIQQVGNIAKELGIDCEYRNVPAYRISQYARGTDGYNKDMEDIRDEVGLAESLGLEVSYQPNLTVRGWDGPIDQSGGSVFAKQAAYHPTKYLNGILRFLNKQPNFQLHTNTRATSIDEEGVEVLGMGRKSVTVDTESGNKVECQHAVQATNIPLQKLSIVGELEYDRTYCIAIQVPRNYVEDCFIYDTADAYRYVRLTACDDEHDYMIIGGCDHEVAHEDPRGRFDELEKWTRDRFTKAGPVDYRWSGQILDPVDYMAFIGLNPSTKHTYIVTGDSGNGLTHGVLASKLIADLIDGIDNPWAKLYSPSRMASIGKVLPKVLTHGMEINATYKRYLQTDITDIEDLVPDSGGVLNKSPGNPQAVYKDADGKVQVLSAVCPHLKGVVCWNPVEKSWDCPVHGSRFSKDGLCIQGPAKSNLVAVKT